MQRSMLLDGDPLGHHRVKSLWSPSQQAPKREKASPGSLRSDAHHATPEESPRLSLFIEASVISEDMFKLKQYDLEETT